MTDTIDRLELLITDSPTEARIRAMNAFASLIKLDKENQVGLHFLSSQDTSQFVNSDPQVFVLPITNPSHPSILALFYFLYLVNSEPGASVLDGVVVPPGALNNGKVVVYSLKY